MTKKILYFLMLGTLLCIEHSAATTYHELPCSNILDCPWAATQGWKKDCFKGTCVVCEPGGAPCWAAGLNGLPLRR